MLDLGVRARAASRSLARAPTEAKNAALLAIAGFDRRSDAGHPVGKPPGPRPGTIERPRRHRCSTAWSSPMRASGRWPRDCARSRALPDPVGEIGELRMRPSGLQVGRMRVPLGVIGIIYESRPNVTADAAGLCLKSGNATILRGGSEALASNLAIAGCIHEGLAAAGLPRDAVQVVETSDRAAVGMLIAMDAHVDVIVPRGGRGLIERLGREARVPIIKHLDGNCHVFIDDRADPDMALTVRGQREDLPLRDLRGDGDAAGRARHRPPGAPGPGGAARGRGGGDPRLRGDPGAGAGCGAGHGGGLGDGVSRGHPRGAGGR